MTSRFFFNDTATTEIYTLSLHDALPILGLEYEGLTLDRRVFPVRVGARIERLPFRWGTATTTGDFSRSEEHTSELQSQSNLVCRLLLEKKKKKKTYVDEFNTTWTE